MEWKRVLFLFSLIFVLSFPNILNTAKAIDYPEIIAGKEIYGKPLEYWAQEYWKWFVTLPPGDIPKNDSTNLNQCILGTDSNNIMVFLMSSYDLTYGAKCTISPDKPILVPLLISECDATVPEPRTKTGKIEDLWTCTRESNEGFEAWDVRLDNKVLFQKAGNIAVNAEMKDEILVRNSSLFTISYPEINRFEVEAGSYPAVVDGYYLILKPLSPGEHVLKYKISHRENIPGADLSYVSGDATYYLTVK